MFLEFDILMDYMSVKFKLTQLVLSLVALLAYQAVPGPLVVYRALTTLPGYFLSKYQTNEVILLRQDRIDVPPPGMMYVFGKWSNVHVML